ncbi:patatin-like phospholipase family protein [Phenylobacterium deserti]|uniref:Patatin-like phospholipase family protein n=1 Tax=Phenylobacterium deserti TaxID=1914756 RepID=A0A328APJ9_9CAUL|nr:patatin-like phospholipase family protein [Phenylobacterium deserti]RAK56933.1 patatin-like phospholipase family protein [Phenylobacterium deserti]
MTKRALVLGGGGPVGIGWECGLIAGFAQNGVDLGQADFILGTSAGAFVGAQLAAGLETVRLADAILEPREPRPERPTAGPAPNLGTLMAMMAELNSGTRNPAEGRAEIGAYALAAQTASEADFLRYFESHLGDAAFPARFACTAVDAQDGGFQLWTEQSGVDLIPAVASSCSVPGIFPPVTVQGRRYVDGGLRSITNLDLAVGYETVVLVAPVSFNLDPEIQDLQDGGAVVVTITPDEASVEAFGPNVMDESRRADAARAGLAQAAIQAEVLRGIWDSAA